MNDKEEKKVSISRRPCHWGQVHHFLENYLSDVKKPPLSGPSFLRIVVAAGCSVQKLQDLYSVV